MNPADIMLSELSQTEKDRYCMTSLMCNLKQETQFKTNKKQNKTKQKQWNGGYYQELESGKFKRYFRIHPYNLQINMFLRFNVQCSDYKQNIINT